MAKILMFLVGLWLLGGWAFLSVPKYIKYKDPKQSIDTRVKDILSQITLEEKIGQMLQIERKVASADVMKKYFIGKVHTIPSSIRYIHVNQS